MAQLLARIDELERRLGINSTNSCKPPSSDPPDAPKKPPRKKRKKRGTKKGHEPHLKELLPPGQVTRSIEIEPGDGGFVISVGVIGHDALNPALPVGIPNPQDAIFLPVLPPPSLTRPGAGRNCRG